MIHVFETHRRLHHWVESLGPVKRDLQYLASTSASVTWRRFVVTTQCWCTGATPQGNWICWLKGHAYLSVWLEGHRAAEADASGGQLDMLAN